MTVAIAHLQDYVHCHCHSPPPPMLVCCPLYEYCCTVQLYKHQQLAGSASQRAQASSFQLMHMSRVDHAQPIKSAITAKREDKILSQLSQHW